MKTSLLTGSALDWAVAKREEYPMGIWYDEDGLPMVRDDEVPEYKPSTNWEQGGKIIEREGMTLRCGLHGWDAELPEFGVITNGTTPLIAAMRCYVASKLGDEVEVPEELMSHA